MDRQRRLLALFLALLDHKDRYRLARYLQTIACQGGVRFALPRDPEMDRLLGRVGTGDPSAAEGLPSILAQMGSQAAGSSEPHCEVARAIHPREELLDRLADYIRGLLLQPDSLAV